MPSELYPNSCLIYQVLVYPDSVKSIFELICLVNLGFILIDIYLQERWKILNFQIFRAIYFAIVVTLFECIVPPNREPRYKIECWT